jgi:DNA repair photolyase
MRKRGLQAPGMSGYLVEDLAGHDGAGDQAQPLVIRGRGAASNGASRCLARHSTRESDGWDRDASDDAPAIATELFPDQTRTLISRNQSPDIPFDRSINPYKGCEHGCIYCFARPTHAYLDLSPGIDFETRIFYKTGAREALIRELGKPGYECRPIAMGTNTDPYQPAERTHRITRDSLEVLLEHEHPVTIVTKGQLVLRDLDLLAELASRGLAHVGVSLTTLDAELKAKLEPRATGPSVRLRMIRGLAEAGVPTSVMVAPVIPFLNDSEMEDILAAAVDAGASQASYILLRLPLEVRPLFEEWLAVHYPLKAKRIMSAISQSRGGKAYDSAWGQRMRGTGPFADLLARRFSTTVKRHGLQREDRVALRTDLFCRPGHRQLSLL